MSHHNCSLSKTAQTVGASPPTAAGGLTRKRVYLFAPVPILCGLPSHNPHPGLRRQQGSAKY
jgi:hypothetical protein